MSFKHRAQVKHEGEKIKSSLTEELLVGRNGVSGGE